MKKINGKQDSSDIILKNKDLFLRLAKGDKSVRNELILNNTKLVNHVYSLHFKNVSFVEYDDLYQAGVLGLIKAVDTYKPIKPFPSYACACIRNEMLMALRFASKYKNMISLDAPLKEDGDSYNELLDSEKYDPDKVVNPESIVIAKEERNVKILSVKKILDSKLKPLYTQILKQRYFSSSKVVSQHAVADKLNISQSYVSRAEREAIKRCKKLLKTDCNLEDIVDQKDF